MTHIIQALIAGTALVAVVALVTLILIGWFLAAFLAINDDEAPVGHRIAYHAVTWGGLIVAFGWLEYIGAIRVFA